MKFKFLCEGVFYFAVYLLGIYAVVWAAISFCTWQLVPFRLSEWQTSMRTVLFSVELIAIGFIPSLMTYICERHERLSSTN